MRSSLTPAGAQLDSFSAVPAVSRAPVLFSPTAPRAEVHPDSDIVLKIAFAIVALETFLAASRGLEILATDFGIIVPYLGVTIYVVALLLTFLSGRLPMIATSRAGILMILFTGWLLVCTPLSQWRGGSVDMLLHEWFLSFIGFLTCGVIVTLAQCRSIAKLLSFGVMCVAALSLVTGKLKEGRLSMEAGTLGNANDLSMLLLLSAPFLLVPFFQKESSPGSKVFAALAGLFVLAVTVRAGSRSGLLAILTMLAVSFLLVPFAAKLKLGLTAIVLAGIVVVSAPSYVLERYSKTFATAETLQDLNDSEIGSTFLRQQLFRESLDLTLQHPVFGVGPGVFVAAQATKAEQNGKRAQWRVSHNSFTQVSSEAGFPGLILYVGAIWAGFANLLWIHKHRAKDPSGWASALSMALTISLVGTTVNFIFSSNAYMVYMPLLIGFSVALRAAAEREFALTPAPVAAVLAPPTSVPGLSKPSGRRIVVPKAPLTPGTSDTSAPSHRYRLLGRPRRLRH